MTLPERVEAVKRKIAAAALEAGRDPAEVTLVAATKVQTSDTIRQAIAAGITVCGENRVQEMTAHLDDDAYAGAALHFIGHLQTNKVKYVVGRVDMIESIDSRRLLEAVEARAAHLDLVRDILLEINVGGEASKSGAAPGEALDLARLAVQMPHIRLRGLMAIPPAACWRRWRHGRPIWTWCRTSCWRSTWAARHPRAARPRGRPWIWPGWPYRCPTSACGG